MLDAHQQVGIVLLFDKVIDNLGCIGCLGHAPQQRVEEFQWIEGRCRGSSTEQVLMKVAPVAFFAQLFEHWNRIAHDAGWFQDQVLATIVSGGLGPKLALMSKGNVDVWSLEQSLDAVCAP